MKIVTPDFFIDPGYVMFVLSGVGVLVSLESPECGYSESIRFISEARKKCCLICCEDKHIHGKEVAYCVLSVHTVVSSAMKAIQ